MDIITLTLANQKASKQISVGIKNVVFVNPNIFKFTLSDNSVQNVTIANFNNYTLAEKSKLASLDETILSKFTYINEKLYFNEIEIPLNNNEQGTLNYNELINLPSINGVELKGNKTIEELGLISSKEMTNIQTQIETNITNNVKADFFTKTETQDFINNKLDTKIDKVVGYGLSKNDFTDIYKNTLDNLNLDGVIRDENYIHTDNNLTNELKDKINSMTNGSRYIGLFEDLNKRDTYNGILTSGDWCTVDNDTSLTPSCKTKYYYNGIQWIFDGKYNDNEFLIDDTSIDSTNISWSVNKINTELDKKANKTDVETSIANINNKLNKKIEITNIKAGTNISIDTDQYGNATINSTSSGNNTDTGTNNYELLSNKPKINGVTVISDKTSEDLNLLDKSYASEINSGSVKMADKAKEIDVEGQLTGSAQYYGVANGGTNEDDRLKLRPFPIGTTTDRIDTLTFDVLTKDIPQAIPFIREIPEVNCFVQAFKQEDSELNVTEIFENYTNENVSNHNDNVVCTEDGLKIKDEYILDNTLNETTGFYETKLNKSQFINLVSLESEVNK